MLASFHGPRPPGFWPRQRRHGEAQNSRNPIARQGALGQDQPWARTRLWTRTRPGTRSHLPRSGSTTTLTTIETISYYH